MVNVSYSSYVQIAHFRNHRQTIKYNTILWEGTIGKLEYTSGSKLQHTFVKWESISLPFPFIQGRLSPLCFRLKNNLYIAGGADPQLRGLPYDKDYEMRRMTCDLFDIQETKYHPSKYRLPYKLFDDIHKVATNEEETLALIITTYGVVIFTEEDGFFDFPNDRIQSKLTRSFKPSFNPFLNKSWLHVSEQEIRATRNAVLVRL